MSKNEKREKKSIEIPESRGFEGIWIPKRLYITDKFNPRMKFFIVEIKSLSKHGYCYATDKHFSEFLGIGVRMVQNMIKELKEDGYLKTEYEYKENTEAIQRRFLILTDKFYKEFYNEEEKCIEKNFNTPDEKKFNDGIEENFNGGTEINCGEKYNSNTSNTEKANITHSSVTDKYAFPDKSEKVDDIYASFPEEKEVHAKKQSRYIPEDYTEEQLIEHIKPVIEKSIDRQCDDGDNAEKLSSTLIEIVRIFYQKYYWEFGERHRILSDMAYENIAERFMFPPDIMCAKDKKYDIKSYADMMDVYFTTEYNKRKKYKKGIDLSISHFMSDEIRSNLFYRACY